MMYAAVFSPTAIIVNWLFGQLDLRAVPVTHRATFHDMFNSAFPSIPIFAVLFMIPTPITPAQKSTPASVQE
jgi:hypothetical protein